MESRFIEVTNGPNNWGKFLLLRFTADDWAYVSKVPDYPDPLLRSIGWGPGAVWVLDLQTREGAAFSPHGVASIDLNTKHQVWVCPMFEPFLVWLYARSPASAPTG